MFACGGFCVDVVGSVLVWLHAFGCMLLSVVVLGVTGLLVGRWFAFRCVGAVERGFGLFGLYLVWMWWHGRVVWLTIASWV